ncbi:unnamed protein product [Nippostrongylus brasiliensis]|uniref:Uncharacterized protein n=1 Tax=Nippostrongylus brasiliensis TaxID=27835 RepID=A0A0N4XDI2_NIPBR|nr:unnamed protein product [Nippostrongylus brasiliensis]
MRSTTTTENFPKAKRNTKSRINQILEPAYPPHTTLSARSVPIRREKADWLIRLKHDAKSSEQLKKKLGREREKKEESWPSESLKKHSTAGTTREQEKDRFSRRDVRH